MKSRRTLLEAGEAVKPAQIRRLEMAATRFLELAGALDADRRFDLAAFDRHGRMEIVENAFF